MKWIIVTVARKYATATATHAEKTATIARNAEWLDTRLNRAEIRAEIRAERAERVYHAVLNWARR